MLYSHFCELIFIYPLITHGWDSELPEKHFILRFYSNYTIVNICLFISFNDGNERKSSLKYKNDITCFEIDNVELEQKMS